MNKFPIVTIITLFILAAFHFYPGCFECLMYHRLHVTSGEVWRLITGHMVHGSDEHIIRDGASFLFFGSILERRLGRFYIPFLVFTALSISLVYYLFIPDVVRFCGLSAVVTGMCGFLLMQEIPRTRKEGPRLLFAFYCVLTAGFVVKIGYEFISGNSFFYRATHMKAAPEAHAMGFLCGVVAWGALRWLKGNLLPPPTSRPSAILAVTGAAIWVAMVLFW